MTHATDQGLDSGAPVGRLPLSGADQVVPVEKRVMRAIGPHDADCDHELDLDGIAKGLPEEAAELRRILIGDAVMRETMLDYRAHNRDAVVARARFELAVGLISLLSMAALMLMLFLVIVPGETTAFVRAGLALALAITLEGIIASIANSGAVQSERLRRLLGPWLLAILRMLFVAGVAAVIFWRLPAESLLEWNKPALVALSVLLFVLLVFADFVSGGMTARMLGLRSLHEAWYNARGRAESSRRLLFMAVLLAEVPRAAAAPLLPVLSQKLEFLRRYQIEVQQSYYAQKCQSNKAGADKAVSARAVAGFVFLALMLVVGGAYLARWSEQGQRVLPDAYSSWIVGLTLHGIDDLFLLLALIALGTYGYLQLRTSLLRERVNFRKFGNTLGQLRLATSAQPGNETGLENPTPLTEARTVAAGGGEALAEDARFAHVERFFREINRLLATEVGDWSALTAFTIVADGDRLRVFSAECLDAECDFSNLVHELKALGSKPFRARKIGFVSARAATAPEAVETRFDGKESSGLAEEGDFIVTNMGQDRTLLRDSHGFVNTYVIEMEEFGRLYEPDSGKTEYGQIYKPMGVVDAVEVAGGFDIAGPWGERQQGSAGYIVRNGKDVYGIHKGLFDKTYARVR